MAQIGLKHLRYSPIDEEGEYTGAKILGKAISTKVTPQYAEGTLYADDEIAEQVSVIVGGDIETVIDDIIPETYAEIYGYTYSQETKNIIRKATDLPIYIGLGRIITKLVNGKYQYVVEFLKKVKFKDALPEEKTKGENIEFGTLTLSGKLFVLNDGTWSIKQYFTDLDEATEYLESLMEVK